MAARQDSRILAVLNLDGSPSGVLANTVLSKPFMVIKHDKTFADAVAPPGQAGKTVQAKVEEELSSAYLKGKPGYRVGIGEANHVSSCEMSVLELWSDSGRRYGVDDASDGQKTLALIREYVEASLISCW